MKMSPPNRRYIDKNTDMRGFTPLPGEATVYSLGENAAPELLALAKRFPAVLNKAMFMLGGHVRKAIRAAIEDGGVGSGTFAGLSEMRRYRTNTVQFGRHSARRDWKKDGAFQNLKKENGLLDAWKQRDNGSKLFGKVARAISFNKPDKTPHVSIGALSASGARFLSAVQSGARGDKGAFQFSGRQAVTPRMRRAMFAAGFPLKSGTTVIEQEERPLIPNVFRAMSPDFETYIMTRISNILEDRQRTADRRSR